MIRVLKEEDIDKVCELVNNDWKKVYRGYVNPELLTEDGCRRRGGRMKHMLLSGKTSEYVWDEEGRILGMLSSGKTHDKDKPEAYEIFRIYIEEKEWGKGIGTGLLSFAEKQAGRLGYKEAVVWVVKENVRAVSFYLRRGYETDQEKFWGEPYLAYMIRLVKKLPFTS